MMETENEKQPLGKDPFTDIEEIAILKNRNNVTHSHTARLKIVTLI